MPRLLLLACALLLTACGGNEASPPTAAPPDAAPPASAAPSAGESDVVVDLDLAVLTLATAARGDRQYSAERVDEQWAVDTRPAGAALDDWLARYAPLRADGRLPGVAPDSVIFEPDAQVSFYFGDDSGRVVSFKRHGDSLAVVSQPEGPVYRLAPDRLDDLVPPAEALTNR